ncbi:hypothetical protein B9479_005044 [Cryptococcus floricola]|uniref:Uncharacterized protein n=1 Tax=Cryptococcus floricola TaxID=2591691 RepID=A0A5D3AS95_9TREE|nr:hypothetical protein B9479_005044 [Cryptococcus floricola]
MSPIPIILHFAPSASPRAPVSFSYAPPSSSAPSTSDAANTAASTSSRRKATRARVLAPGAKHATFTPLHRPIINRCIAYTASLSSSSAEHGAHPSTAHPYSPSSDWGNTRSFNPSDLEVIRDEKPKKRLNKAQLREKKANEDRVKRLVRELKGETVDDEGSLPDILEPTPTPSVQGKSYEEPVSDKGQNDLAPGTGEEADEKTGEHGTTLPAPIQTAPVAKRTTLKRTRSFNNLVQQGNGVHAASPLRAVIGANGYEANNDQPPAKQLRRTSTSHLESPRRDERRAYTHSPSGSAPEPLPESARSPRTVPLAAGVLQPSRTRNSRATSAALASVAGESSGMRRAISNVLPASGRSASVGSDGARERSRREVTLPNRLKDYDT